MLYPNPPTAGKRPTSTGTPPIDWSDRRQHVGLPLSAKRLARHYSMPVATAVTIAELAGLGGRAGGR
jgi:hypothetical protein